MKLYRYLTKEELIAIINNEYKNIGSVNLSSKYANKNNTHKYKTDVRYLHFYFAEKEIKRIKGATFHDIEKNYYVCEFEIPFYRIFNNIGQGFYYSEKANKYSDYVYEVALPISKMKSIYLKKFKEFSEYTETEWIDFDYEKRWKILSYLEEKEK